MSIWTTANETAATTGHCNDDDDNNNNNNNRCWTEIRQHHQQHRNSTAAAPSVRNQRRVTVVAVETWQPRRSSGGRHDVRAENNKRLGRRREDRRLVGGGGGGPKKPTIHASRAAHGCGRAERAGEGRSHVSSGDRGGRPCVQEAQHQVCTYAYMLVTCQVQAGVRMRVEQALTLSIWLLFCSCWGVLLCDCWLRRSPYQVPPKEPHI